VGLPDAIGTARASAKKLRGNRSGNEANTKALLIEPMLAALGWDPTDLDVVDREVRVFDGTCLDYALKVDGTPRIYVEAKGVGERLSDAKYVAQAVNYANNDGVVWCVLTNGLQWALYKTNESAPMDQKLLFEVDLSDEGQSPSDLSNFLRLMSREAVIAGDLDRFGDRVFTDGRVRKVLAAIASDPPSALLEAVSRGLGHPPVPEEALRRSLARILNAKESPADDGTGRRRSGEQPAPKRPPGPPQPPRGQEYDLDHHLANKSALIQELFSEVNSFALALGPDVTRRIRKHYVGYFRGKKSFFTVELQQRRVVVYLGLRPPTAHPWSDEVMRDVTGIGHFGMGDTEYSLTRTDQLTGLQQLIQLAYDAIR
jgi:predicted transport protein